ncbi:MAG: Alkyl hydroperoxide reductase subunit C [Alphaproteobacteria bacterium MarineAlpha2_Bin1]|nr:MAG: Alkyl hydroperoxide reductase subunit C [Alphaproteobacteria bacterium MarineAlpha2_Bin1]
MTLRINDLVPDFSANTTEGEISFHEWINDSWVVLFSHPKDFTPVCTTELGYMAKLNQEFKERNCKIIGISVDTISDHQDWKKDIQLSQGYEVNYPLIADNNLEIAKLFNMLPANSEGKSEERSAADNATVRSVFLIGPDNRIKAMLTYPMSTGRNFDEILRLLDSCQLTENYNVATPVNWKTGDDVIIPPKVNNEEAIKIYPEGWRDPLPYLRFIPIKNIKRVKK